MNEPAADQAQDDVANSTVAPNPWEPQRAALGAFLRHQRELANLSLRQLSQATSVSNAYLSQIERGLHDPTLRVLVQIGEALHLSIEDMLSNGVRSAAEGPAAAPGSVEAAVRADPLLGPAEQEALLAVYRSYLRSHPAPSGEHGDPA